MNLGRIRPPYYEVDFAAEIMRQCKKAGVGASVNSGQCTASDSEKYYFYRRDQGKTGRHFAVVVKTDLPVK